MRQRLAARGYDARVFASGSYWRVRVGRYETQAAAAAALGRMRERGLNGFVVEAEPQ
jgi:cell division protein FtsN